MPVSIATIPVIFEVLLFSLQSQNVLKEAHFERCPRQSLPVFLDLNTMVQHWRAISQKIEVCKEYESSVKIS